LQTPVIFVNTPVFYVENRAFKKENRCFKVVAKINGGIAISPIACIALS
jgi:hypothetical protein